MYLPQPIIDKALQNAPAKAMLRQLDATHAPRCHDKTSAVLHGFSPDAKQWRLWWECAWCGGKSEPFILSLENPFLPGLASEKNSERS